MMVGLGLLAFVLGVHVSKCVINDGHSVSSSSRCAASKGAFSSLWTSQIHECSRHILDRQDNLFFVLMVTLQRCCVELVSVMMISGSRHFVQYLACLADSALRVTLILIHCGQRVRRLPRCLSWKWSFCWFVSVKILQTEFSLV